MHIRLYITKLTDEVCAERWGFKVGRVASWRRGRRPPSRPAALKILEIEKGVLTINDILGPMPEGEELKKQLEEMPFYRRKTDKPLRRYKADKLRAEA